MREHGASRRLVSVHPSVCLSDTLVYCSETAKRIVKIFSGKIAPSFWFSETI